MAQSIIIAGTGFYAPAHPVSNDDLVASFNAYATAFNTQHQAAIEAGTVKPHPLSSSEFIEKASGIKTRYLIAPDGILNPARMRPYFPRRPDDEMSLQCEMAYRAATAALDHAQVDASTIDLIILACSNVQRAYPAISIELQAALGAKGFAFDMNVACSSATFAIEMARSHLLSGQASRALVVNPEICSGHLDFKNRDAHFIFGDASTAIVLSRAEDADKSGFIIESTALKTQYSNNIRNNFGYLDHAETIADDAPGPMTRLFSQNGRKVFKEVVPMAAEHMTEHLARHALTAHDIKRFWLHQANLNMNQLIAKKLYGRPATQAEAPCILDEYANTGSPGSILAFHHTQDDMVSGERGMICSFGAGYSIGSLLVKKQ